MDLQIAWDPLRFRGDWVTASDDLAIGSDLETAVLLSLFTDRLAAPGFVPTDGTTDLRGWWGDSFEPSPIGSRLWQLNRAVKSDAASLLAQVQDACREALQWLLDAGVIATLGIAAQWLNSGTVGLRITITEPNGVTTPFNFAWAWAGIGGSGAGAAAPGAATSSSAFGQLTFGQSSFGA